MTGKMFSVVMPMFPCCFAIYNKMCELLMLCLYKCCHIVGKISANFLRETLNNKHETLPLAGGSPNVYCFMFNVKIGCGSEKKNKQACFSFRSPCTIFAHGNKTTLNILWTLQEKSHKH